MEDLLFESIAADFESSDEVSRYADLQPEFTPDTIDAV